MAGYTKQRSNWLDFPSTSTPILAANLNAWEQAIYDLKTRITGTSRTDIGPALLVDMETSGTGAGGTATYSETGVGTIYVGSNFSYFNIASDNIAQTDTQGYVNGSTIEHHYGGAAASGGRQTFFVNSFFDGGATTPSGTSNTNHFYLATQSSWWGNSNDGGSSTGPTYKGAGFGLGALAGLRGSATYFNNLSAAEFNVVTDPAMHCSYIAGIQIAASLQSNGDTYDTAVAISGLNAGGHIGFKSAFLIGDMNGLAALASTSTLMQVINHSTLAKGFDFSNTTFTSYILKSNGFQIAAPAGDHTIDIGRQDGSASTPALNFHSGASATAYDARFLGNGGTGATGLGSVNFYGATLSLQGQAAGSSPLAINALTGQTADLSIWQVNSVTKLELLASGQFKTIAGNEATGAGTPLFGTNSPAVTNTAPYKWLKFTTSDGSQVYVPAWK